MPTPRVTIDSLPSKATPDADDSLVIQDSGVTKKTTVGGLLELPTTGLTAHLADTVDAHDASAISAIPSGIDVNGTTVQAQLGQLASAVEAFNVTGGVDTTAWHRWEGTQADYDALGTYSNDTIYAVYTTITPPPVTAPVTPINVTALAGDASASISWTASAGATTYIVERSTVPTGGFTTLPGSTVTGTNYFAAPLTNGTTYYFRVTAHNAVGDSAPSTVVAVLPDVAHPTLPGTPTNFTVNAGPGSVTVNWLSPASNGNSPITGYSVERSTTASSGPFAVIATVSGSTFSYLSSGLTNGTTYYFRVYATNAIGNGLPTAVLNAVPTTGATVPSAPTNVVATPGAAAVTVTWDVPTSTGGATLDAYVIERSTLPTSGFVTVGTVPATAPHSFFNNPLTPGVTYYFRITVQNVIGTSPASAIVNAAPTGTAAPPSDWATAMATGNLTTITAWYDTYTGHLSESFDPANLWGPGQSAGVIVNSAWLTANTGPKVVLSAGRWTITGLHCAWVNMHVANVTLSHCWIDRPNTLNAWGVDASPSSNGDVAVLGTIVDHCTLQGNFGSGSEGDYGDAIQYYNNVSHVADGFIIRYCEISGYRAGLYTAFGTTCEYNWVHDLYIYGVSHNTAASIRGENTRIYRNLLTDGTSSAVSLYADNTPYTNFEVNENILKTTSADYDINFPMRSPNYWNLLYDHSVLGTGHVDGAVLSSTFGYRRECNGNWFIPGLIGLGSDMQFVTSSRGNKLLDGTPVLFDEGGTPTPTQPLLLKMRYNELGGGVSESQQTYEFTPSPNSTILVFVGIVNAGHSTTQAPTVIAVGQYPQAFSKILESPFTAMTGDDNHGLGLFLYKAQTSTTTSFEHIIVDPYPGTATAMFTIWVYEITNMTGLSLAHSSVKGQAAVGFGNTLSTITSNNLSAAATTGRVCMAFAAGAAVSAPGSAAYGNVAGWTRTGVQNTTFSASNPFCTGAVYWNKTFTGTNITIPSLGTGTYCAGVLLAEFA